MRLSKNVVVFALAYVLLMICFTACSNEAQTPSFEKMLMCTDTNDCVTYYECDNSWKKTVEAISIPQADNSVVESCIVQDVLKCQDNMYEIIWEIKFKEGKPKGVFQFDAIEVQWDDGTTQVADVGHMAVYKPGKYGKYELLDATDTREIQLKKFDRISIKPTEYAQYLSNCYDDITINGNSITDFVNGETVEVKKGNKLEIDAKYDAEASGYHEVMVQLVLTCSSSSTGEKEKVVCEFFGHGPHDQETDIELGE